MGTDIEGVFKIVSPTVLLRRFAMPRDISDICRSLVSYESRSMTGAVLLVDGGAAIVDVSGAALSNAGVKWGHEGRCLLQLLLCSCEGRRIGERFVNFLAHLFLSGNAPELLVGNLMGDFVKGRLHGRFPPGIERGISLYRRIDSFAGQNRHFLRSKRRLNKFFGHYRGMLVDLFYNHFLAAHWEDYAHMPLSFFCQMPGGSFASIRSFSRRDCAASCRSYSGSGSRRTATWAVWPQSCAGYLLSGLKDQTVLVKEPKN